MKMLQRKDQQGGFAIGTILLAVILIAIIAAAIAVASRSSSGGSTKAKARVNASTVLTQGGNLSQAFERAILDGGFTADNISFNVQNASGDKVGLFNATEGLTTVQVPPVDALVKGTVSGANKNWYLVKGFGVANVSDNGIFAMLPGVTLAVCATINNMLQGSDYTDKTTGFIPTTSVAMATLFAAASSEEASASATTAADTSPASGTALAIADGTGATKNAVGTGQPEGCINAGGTFVYYKLLKSNS